eukprot:10570159-Alexandrium_andersonii.AAC.1
MCIRDRVLPLVQACPPALDEAREPLLPNGEAPGQAGSEAEAPLRPVEPTTAIQERQPRACSPAPEASL